MDNDSGSSNPIGRPKKSVSSKRKVLEEQLVVLKVTQQ